MKEPYQLIELCDLTPVNEALSLREIYRYNRDPESHTALCNDLISH